MYVLCNLDVQNSKTNCKVETYKALFDSFFFSAENVYFIVLYAYEMNNGMCLFYEYILPQYLFYYYGR